MGEEVKLHIQSIHFLGAMWPNSKGIGTLKTTSTCFIECMFLFTPTSLLFGATGICQYCQDPSGYRFPRPEYLESFFLGQ